MSQTQQSDRAFGVMFSVVFFVFAGLGWWIIGKIPMVLIVLSGLFLLTALAIPSRLMPLNRLWSFLAHKLSVVSNFVILSSVYVTILLPIGFVWRLMGKNPLHVKPDPIAETYWQTVDRQTTEQTFGDLF